MLDSAFNDIPSLHHAALPDVIGFGSERRVDTEATLDAALANALADSSSLHIIEAVIPRGDIRAALTRLTSEPRGRIRTDPA